ncbi:probable Bax inhibitor 1 [Haliotis cracherodii]|uniref:probable Bax inhibitor 1 n=1 Tax=Haliotis rufescens TaxID=6454 RepID=UPI001EAFA6F9|nr:probable Bax inhibitor 1 [Haliotis rufescens]
MATRNEFLPSHLFKFDHLEGYVQTHLKNVYSSLAIGMISAAVGAYVHLFTGLMQAGLMTMLGSIGLMLWLAFTKHEKGNQGKRLAIFSGFTFCSGMSLGPLLDMVIALEPSIIPTALMGTFVVFISFSLASLYSARDRTFLYMGGFLMSALSWMLMLGFANIFFGSTLLYEINLYVGLAIFCAFILYDTQLIIEKRRRGDDDYIWHSVDLFLDFIQVFRRLLIILSKKEGNKKKERN